MEKELNGYIMSADIPVAKIDHGITNVLDRQRAPLILKDGLPLEIWLLTRVVDISRPNIKLLIKELGLEEATEPEIALRYNAASITDNFWYRPLGKERLKWQDIRFNDNPCAKTALLGKPLNIKSEYIRTPELTNIGSYEKCWEFDGYNFYLYKKQTPEKAFCEYLVYMIGDKVLHFDMAEYEITENGVKSRNFTNNHSYNYEPMFELIKDEEGYEVNFNILNKISFYIAKEYLQIIYMDTLVNNYDRHSFNIGILRNAANGEIVKLAPNFDNNEALIHEGVYPSTSKMGFDELLFTFLNNNSQAKEVFKTIKLHDIKKEEVKQLIPKTKTDVDIERLTSFLERHSFLLNQRLKTILSQ